MVGAAFRLVIFPDSCLLAIGVPLMLTLLLPAEQARLMDPLIGTAPQHQRILLPDTAAGKLESCILECLSEVQPFRISVPYIDAAVIASMMFAE